MGVYQLMMQPNKSRLYKLCNSQTQAYHNTLCYANHMPPPLCCCTAAAAAAAAAAAMTHCVTSLA
jgi:hypothetical protein